MSSMYCTAHSVVGGRRRAKWSLVTCSDKDVDGKTHCMDTCHIRSSSSNVHMVHPVFDFSDFYTRIFIFLFVLQDSGIRSREVSLEE